MLNTLTNNRDRTDFFRLIPIIIFLIHSIKTFSYPNAELFLLKGDTLLMHRELDSCKVYYQKGLGGYKTKYDTSGIIRSRNKIGDYLVKAQLYDSAIKYLKANIQLIKIAGNHQHELAHSYEFLGQVFRWKKKGETSILYHKKALRIRKEVLQADHLDIARSYNLIGNVHLQIFHGSDSALYYFNKSRSIHDVLDNRDLDLGMLFYDYSKAHQMRGELENSLLYAQEALNIFKNFPIYFVRLNATTKNQIGDILQDRGEFDKAETYYRSAITERSNALGNDSFYLSSYYNSLSKVLLKTDRRAEAIRSSRNSVRINFKNTEPDMKWAADSYELMADAYARNSPDSAMFYYRKSYTLSYRTFGRVHPKTGGILGKIGQLYVRLGEFDSALYTFQSSIYSYLDIPFNNDINELPEPDQLTANLGLINSMRHKAGIFYDKYKRFGLKSDLVRALDHYIGAIRTLDNNLALHEMDESRLSLTEFYLGLRNEAIAVAYDLYRLDNESEVADLMLTLIEGNRSNILFNELRRLDYAEKVGLLDLLNQERVSKAEIRNFRLNQTGPAIADSTFFTLYQRYRDVKNTIDQRLNYSNTQETATKVTKKILQNTVGPDEILINYCWTESGIYVFAITKEDVHIKKLIEVKALMPIIQDYTELLSPQTSVFTTEKYKAFTNVAYQIYKFLLSKVIRNLGKTKEKLSIIVSGNLGYIPFESLISNPSKSESINYNSLSYLIKRFTISYYNSSQLYLRSKQEARSSDIRVLAMSYSDSRKEHLKINNISNASNRGKTDHLDSDTPEELPGAAVEIATISELFPGEYFWGRNATISNLKKHHSDHNIVHFAVHAESSSDEFQEGFIVLRNRENLPDTLFAYEIPSLQMKKDLVFLSGCKTNIGKIYKGEGVQSLTREFIASGTKIVISSLWEISDVLTAEIVEDFYGLLFDGLSPQLSLRQSKLNYLNRSNEFTSHPKNWAGLVCYGNESEVTPTVNKLIYLTLVVLSLAIGAYFLRQNYRAIILTFRQV